MSEYTETVGWPNSTDLRKNKEKTLEDDADSLDMGMGDYIFSMLADNESEIEGYLECDAVE